MSGQRVETGVDGGVGGGVPGGVSSGLQDSASGDDAPRREAPDAQALARFQAALKPEAAATVPLPSPMSLFGAATAPAVNAPSEPNALSTRIARLLVDDGRHGGRAVRLTLDDETLPGTDIEIGEHEAALHVVFFCRDAATRRKLQAQMHELATLLVSRLQREVCVSVGGDERDDVLRVAVRRSP